MAQDYRNLQNLSGSLPGVAGQKSSSWSRVVLENPRFAPTPPPYQMSREEAMRLEEIKAKVAQGVPPSPEDLQFMETLAAKGVKI